MYTSPQNLPQFNHILPSSIYKPAETVSLNLNTYRRQKVNVSLNFHCFHFYCLTQDIRQVSLGSRTNYDPELECE